MAKSSKLLYTSPEWTFEDIERIWQRIDIIGKQELGFDYYSPQIEIISSEQMLDNYSSVAMPIMYNHWSFGKAFVQNEYEYKQGNMGLAYEVVINTNPSIAYLMENNTTTMQALVLAHASVGHSSFFKNNYLFKEWSDADSILEYLRYAKNYIASCEEKYGYDEVEYLLDACHSLQHHGVHKYRKPNLKKEIERQKQQAKWDHEDQNFNDMWRTLPQKPLKSKLSFSEEFKKERVFPEENLLYFIEKYSPVLKNWQREIVRIVRKIAQYFYPQMQTQVMNEGWACLCHFTIMSMMQEQGYISEGSYLEMLHNHSGVIAQPAWNSINYSGINVYALGFAMMSDLKRMCENPDDEDKRYFPDICNTDWTVTLPHIIANYRDESFIQQFLSLKVIRKLKLFSIYMDEDEDFYEVTHTHDEEYLKEMRRALSAQYDLSKRIPQLEISGIDWEGDRTMYLQYLSINKQRVYDDTGSQTVKYMLALWGHPIYFDVVDGYGQSI